MIAAGCNGWRNWADIQCSWDSLSGIIEHWGEYSRVMQAVAAPGHWNDPDMLLIGAKDASGKACLSVAEERTQMAIWCLSAAPLIMGNDARDVRNASLQILLNRDAIAIDQDAKGEQGVRLVDGAHQVWARNLTGGAVAVGLYNSGGAPPICRRRATRGRTRRGATTTRRAARRATSAPSTRRQRPRRRPSAARIRSAPASPSPSAAPAARAAATTRRMRREAS